MVQTASVPPRAMQMLRHCHGQGALPCVEAEFVRSTFFCDRLQPRLEIVGAMIRMARVPSHAGVILVQVVGAVIASYLEQLQEALKVHFLSVCTRSNTCWNLLT